MTEHNQNENQELAPEITEHIESVDETGENYESLPDPSPAIVKRRTNDRLLSFIDYVEIIAVAIGIVLVLFSFVFRTCTVDGNSMKNTLFHGEKLVISDLFYTPERGDVIVFHQTGRQNMPLVKRVIAIEGDTVVINFDTWEVTITDKDGKTTVLDEPYVNIDSLRHNHSGTHTYTVPEDCVFVLGDNRNDSMDSTDENNIGYVNESRILGKVILRLTPFSKIGFIN